MLLNQPALKLPLFFKSGRSKVVSLLERTRDHAELKASEALLWSHSQFSPEWLKKYAFPVLSGMRTVANVATIMSGVHYNTMPRVYAASVSTVTNAGGMLAKPQEHAPVKGKERFPARTRRILSQLKNPIDNFEFTQSLLMMVVSAYFIQSGCQSARPMEVATGASILLGAASQSQLFGGEYHQNMKRTVQFFMPSYFTGVASAVAAHDKYLMGANAVGVAALALQYVSHMSRPALTDRIEELRTRLHGQRQSTSTRAMPQGAVLPEALARSAA
jgi:hypothetical protein